MPFEGRLLLDKVEGFLFVLSHQDMEGALFGFYFVKTRLQIVQIIRKVFCAAVELGPQVKLRALPLLVINQDLWKLPVEFGGDQILFDDINCGHDAKTEEAADHSRQHHERNENPL